MYRVLDNLPEIYKNVFPIMQRPLKKLLDRIQLDNVEELWVFGSCVSEVCGQDSDIDVCIVGDVDLEITKGLWNLDGIPVDFLIVSKKEFEDEYANINSVYRDVKDKGVKFYGDGKLMLTK